MTLILLPKAVADIEQAFGYVHAENPAAAKNLKTAFSKAFERLINRPHIGRASLKGDHREWSMAGWPYIIVYRTQDDDIEILRVWHTAGQICRQLSFRVWGP